jgi:hypothetical protein
MTGLTHGVGCRFVDLAGRNSDDLLEQRCIAALWQSAHAA